MPHILVNCEVLRVQIIIDLHSVSTTSSFNYSRAVGLHASTYSDQFNVCVVRVQDQILVDIVL